MRGGERVFVTGGTGMVGANLIRRLIEAGYRVRMLIRSRRHPMTERLPIKEVRGSLDDVETLARGMDGCGRAFHVAGMVSYRRQDAPLLHQANVIGTRNLLEAARAAGVERVVHTSSTAAVGISEGPEEVLDESSPFPERFRSIPYMWTKHLAEEEVARAVSDGMDVVIVNPSTIFGAGDVKLNTGRLIRYLSSGKVRAAPPGGNSVVGVEDVVRGHLLAMDRGESGRRYILSSENMTIREMMSRIRAVLGHPPVPRTIPRWARLPLSGAVWIGSRLRPTSDLSPAVIAFSFRYRYFDSTRAREEIGWTPAQSFERAVESACRFYKSIGP